MLGSLARWLRFMGYDTAYPAVTEDNDLIGLSREEERTLLTRDKELVSRCAGAIAIRSDVLDEQIREVAAVLPLRLVKPLSRCSLCNTVIQAISPEDVAGIVPEGVRSRHQEFWRCPSCGRVYWQGSHWDKMVERLNRLDLPAP